MSSNLPQRPLTMADLLLHLLDPTGAIQNNIHLNPVPGAPALPTATTEAGAVAGTAEPDAPGPVTPVTTGPVTTGPVTTAPATIQPPLRNSTQVQLLFQNLIAHLGASLQDLGEDEGEDATPEPPTTTRLPGLAGFATDRENVHTRPAQTETSRTIQILMEPAPDSVKTLLDEWTQTLGDAESHDVKTIQEYVLGDELYSVMVGDHEFRTHVSLQNAFYALWTFARTLPADLRVALAWELRDLWVLETSRARLERVAELVCAWNPALAPEAPVPSWLHHWITHRHDGLLNSIRNAWCEALSSTSAPLHRVMEEPIWMEFRYDVYNTVNFDVHYDELLRRTWDYALAHPDVTNEIGVRLAEEVVDGVGLCAQGKMTRLANVLRGFDARLESVSTLSTREQLQNRMITLRAFPMEERKAAAEAVFAELSIPPEEQASWLEALLE